MTTTVKTAREKSKKALIEDLHSSANSPAPTLPFFPGSGLTGNQLIH